ATLIRSPRPSTGTCPATRAGLWPRAVASGAQPLRTGEALADHWRRHVGGDESPRGESAYVPPLAQASNSARVIQPRSTGRRRTSGNRAIVVIRAAWSER